MAGAHRVNNQAARKTRRSSGRHRTKSQHSHAFRWLRAGVVTVVAGGSVLAQPAAAQSLTVDADVALAASTVTFVDGTNYPNGSTRMANILQGYFNQPQFTPTYLNDTQVYPGTLGLYSGLGKPTGDQSVALGQQALDTQIKTTRAADPTGTETVVAYSLGAVAASHEYASLQQQGYPQQGLAFVLVANPERPNGGILARLPAGTYIPLLGITGGNATSSGGAPVIMVTRQYDGIADAPAYPVNVLADANALLGAYYLHSNYNDVNPSAPGNIVTTSPDGTVTDILVPAPPGQLPIFMPLAQVGVPQPILVALDPVTRALIETGYTRTGDPSQQVRFAPLPPPSAWFGDAQSVLTGAIVTVELLPGAIVASVPHTPTAPPPLPPAPPAAPAFQSTVATVSSPQVPLTTASSAPTITATTIGQQPQSAPTPPPSSATSASPKSSSTSTPPTSSTSNLQSGNKVTPGSTSPAGIPSNGGNLLQSALAGITKQIGSLTGSSAPSSMPGNTSSATPGANGSSASHIASKSSAGTTP